jgi:Fe2+ or Zn2+ uptake regulation protein
MTEEFATILKVAEQERREILELIGDRSLSAASLTRLLYPRAAIPGYEYHHIYRRLRQLRKEGLLLTDDPKTQQERLYYKAENQMVLL